MILLTKVTSAKHEHPTLVLPAAHRLENVGCMEQSNHGVGAGGARGTRWLSLSQGCVMNRVWGPVHMSTKKRKRESLLDSPGFGKADVRQVITFSSLGNLRG